MEQLLETLKGLQGQVISDDLLKELQSKITSSSLSSSQNQRSSQVMIHSEDLVIDGETEMDDMLVAQRVAQLENARLAQVASMSMSRSYVIPQGVDGLADEDLSELSEDDVMTPETSVLNKLLADKGLMVEEDSECEDESALPVPVDFSKHPSHLCHSEPLIPVGIVDGVVEGLLIVRGYQVALDENSLLCLEEDPSRAVVGCIIEVFGAVQHPSYLVAQQGLVQVGSKLVTVPSQSKLILLDEENGIFSISGQKDEAIEYESDDEQNKNFPITHQVEAHKPKLNANKLTEALLAARAPSAFRWN